MKPYWFDELERMNRLLRRFTDSPAAQFIREMERQRQMLEPPGFRALREWQSRTMPHSLCVNDGLAAGFSNIVGQYDALKLMAAIQHLYPLAEDMRRSLLLLQGPALPVIQAFSSSLILASRNDAALRAFEGTFAGQILQTARGMVEAADEEIPDRISDITELLGRRIEKASRGPISIEGWVQIILAILLHITNVLSERKMELNLTDRLRSIEERFPTVAPTQGTRQGRELRMVSTSILRVRAKPSKRAQVIGRLTRNSLVRILSTQGEWARVEFFDFIGGKTSTGWVAARYLQVLPRDYIE